MRRDVVKAKKCPVTGKVSYKDTDSAARALANVARSVEAGQLADTGRLPTRYYECQFCPNYHLTSEGET